MATAVRGVVVEDVCVWCGCGCRCMCRCMCRCRHNKMYSRLVDTVF